MEATEMRPRATNARHLQSFACLRVRNLKTLYGSDDIAQSLGRYTDKDKSPIGCVDRKIRGLVNLINRHPDFVTLSSCSGRVALFDPSGSSAGCAEAVSEGDVSRGTEASGKGRGRWIFVTHDVLPDLGERMIGSLREAGRERRRRRQNHPTAPDDEPVTCKHEPVLMHVGASSLEAGKKMLHIAKSTCAMRESGLVVTDTRVTVELRTTGTSLCLPLILAEDSIQPSEEYLKSLAKLANERMLQNEALIEKLFTSIQSELFDEVPACGPSLENVQAGFRSLPPLNLWKTAAVVLPRSGGDLDVLAFGGQGVGPEMKTCRRWDSILRLARRDGEWALGWDIIPFAIDESGQFQFVTRSATYRLEYSKGLGAREGHSACTLPGLLETTELIAVFGGRTGGPLSPSDDLFFMEVSSENGEDVASIRRLAAVAGTWPEPRFGHSMTALPERCSSPAHGRPLFAIAGGTGVLEGLPVVYSSVYLLTQITDGQTDVNSLQWSRLDDMPGPRVYHTASLSPCTDEKDSHLFIFGGMSEFDDPFSTGASCPSFLYPLQKEIRGDSEIVDGLGLEPRLGSASCNISLGRHDLTLILGGVRHPGSTSRRDDPPLTILAWRGGEASNLDEPARLVSPDGSRVDLGSCAHHCLLGLPPSDGVPSAVALGGGVPSFSFGQSYAKTHLIEVCHGTLAGAVNETSVRAPKHAETSTSEHEEEQGGKPVDVEVDVVYVAARHAKQAKTELESRNVFDRRFKMVKVERGGGDQSIAIPIIGFDDGLEEALSGLLLGRGREVLPPSSSTLAKMKQKR
ncbi:hypothetical protein THAOC_12836 [Thalassiosira oceanica]|uniref:tRNA(Phe) 7-[(3-amino-3-carboxypropyl)-4-demethylwyosine(37)-N(4)]-methyltransferase n=1 Tax=Thalassiosira oceanica TaxID=159749 RepID=K0SLS3_THAOC|nr:hypothetical protein THAOC_12836 [Thalassiosira oceanica]|eukprot:EJK66255.1 hypothetical protein THAOC_12836 [Thalassiosira oceanica]